MQSCRTPHTFMSRANGGLSRPDLTIVSANLEPNTKTWVLDDVGSDHLPVLTRVRCRGMHQLRVKRWNWNYRKADWKLFQQVSDRDLTRVDLSGDIDTVYGQVRDAVMGAAKKAIPKGSVREGAPNWSSELRSAVKERREARKKAQRLGDTTSRTEYNRLTARVRGLTREAKRDKWERTCSRLNEGTTGTCRAWKLFSALERSARPPPPTVDKSELKGTRHPDLRMAERLNKHFAKISKGKRGSRDTEMRRERIRMENESLPTNTAGNLTRPFSVSELGCALSKCRKGKAPGPDGISNEMLMGLSATARDIVLKCINMTWEEGKLPRAWKRALIIPLIKNGKEAGAPESYRPISLTSCFGKVAERMVNRRLTWHLESSNMLSCYQSGFRKGMTTMDQLIRLTQSILDGYQRKEHTLGVFLDFQKAYDKVWRSGLLVKMMKLGIRGSLYRWVKNFLSERTIMTRVEGATSPQKTLEEGLPQGSAVSCTLFLVFINDLMQELNSDKALFADDLVVWQTGPDQTALAKDIQPVLKRIGDFCENWKMDLNTDKSVYSVFTLVKRGSDKIVALEIQGKGVARDDFPKYLGVTLDRGLSVM